MMKKKAEESECSRYLSKRTMSQFKKGNYSVKSLLLIISLWQFLRSLNDFYPFCNTHIFTHSQIAIVVRFFCTVEKCVFKPDKIDPFDFTHEMNWAECHSLLV